MVVVNRGGNTISDQISEADTRNEAEVIANDANPHCTGVYGSESPATACSGLTPSVSWCFHFHAL